MKKLLTLAIVVSLTGLMACSDESSMTPIEMTSQGADSATETPTTDLNLVDEFLVIDVDKKVSDPDLQKIINETISEYKNIVTQVRSEFSKHKELTKKDFSENIAEIKSAYEQQNVMYTQKCSKITSNNENSCNDFGSKTHALKMKYESIEVKLKNTMKKLVSDEINQLKKFQADMKNKVMDLKNQAGE
jgi:hypothetical protein